VLRNRKALRDADIIYARNADMLAVAAMSKSLTGAKAPIVYEALDVQPIFIGDSLINHALRLIERRLLAASRLLVVSSPAFMTRYFEPLQNYTGPWYLLENKVVLKSAPRPQRAQRRRNGHGKPWVIGWFGVIRCQRSLAILEKLATAYPDDVQVHIRGLPSETNGITAKLLRQVGARQSNIHYFGPYHSPRDLEDIYGMVDLVWAVDFSAAGSNSDWLIPNRLYEGGLYCVPSIARQGTATGEIVMRDASGWCLSEPLEQTLAEFIGSLDEGRHQAVAHRLEEMERSKFVDETDTSDLLMRLTQIASSEHAKVGPRSGEAARRE
jgi:succinoglycan biosynthesis protein ExoL